MTHIRKAKKEDLGHIIGLYKDLHINDAPLPDKNKLDEIWKNILSSSTLNYFVAEDEGEIIATCNLNIIPSLTRGARPYGLIENVVTKKAHQGKGHGTALLKHTLKYAWDKNCYKVMLLTSKKEERLFKFYQNAGFKLGIKTGFIAYPES